MFWSGCFCGFVGLLVFFFRVLSPAFGVLVRFDNIFSVIIMSFPSVDDIYIYIYFFPSFLCVGDICHEYIFLCRIWVFCCETSSIVAVEVMKLEVLLVVS